MLDLVIALRKVASITNERKATPSIRANNLKSKESEFSASAVEKDN